MTESITRNPSSFLYRFLVSPRFRVGRYALLITVLAVIAVNQASMTYSNSFGILGRWIYLLIAFNLLTFIVAIFFNLYSLIPRFLVQRRYLAYFLTLGVAMLLVLVMLILQEYTVYDIWPEACIRGQFWSTSVLLNCLSSLLMNTLAVVGLSMTILLKLWMVDNQRVMQLEKLHLQSELEQLKEQVSPELLFKVLHMSGDLAIGNPQKASVLLMKLSQLLRYQLYDCARERVLLSAEVQFLANYVALEQFLSDKFSCAFVSSGAVNRTLVPPLLFIPFVQHAIVSMNQQETKTALSVRFEVEEERVVFLCHCPGVDLGHSKDLERSVLRLNLLYGDHYSLSTGQDGIRLQLEGGLSWKQR